MIYFNFPLLSIPCFKIRLNKFLKSNFILSVRDNRGEGTSAPPIDYQLDNNKNYSSSNKEYLCSSCRNSFGRLPKLERHIASKHEDLQHYPIDCIILVRLIVQVKY